MKITSGKYVDQFAIGITWLRYPNVMWSIIFDFGIWYIEVSNDFKDDEDDYNSIFNNTIVCDRCGSPNDVYRKILQNRPTKDEWVCAECLRYEDYMNSLNDEK